MGLFLSLFVGYVLYKHNKGESGGSFSFKFDVVDSEENTLLDQSFYISILGKCTLCFHTDSNICHFSLFDKYAVLLYF